MKCGRNLPLTCCQLREQLVFKDYDYTLVDKEKETVIGLPRVLSYWENMPFWKTFWKALGYQVSCLTAVPGRSMRVVFPL